MMIPFKRTRSTFTCQVRTRRRKMSTSCTLHQNLYSRLQSIMLILVFLPSVINASGRFEFRFDSFDNPMSRDEHGICCSNSSVSSSSDFSSSCSGHCRVYFRVCLKHYQNVIDTDSPCTFGEVTTPVLGNDRINDPGYTVPIAFNFSWPVSLLLTRNFSHALDLLWSYYYLLLVLLMSTSFHS